MNPLKVLITGATGGLGSALTMQLAKENVELLLLDKKSGSLDALSDQVTSEGFDEPGVCPMDLSQAGSDHYEGIVRVLKEEYGGLDVLIHCAAEFHGLQPMDQVTPPQWLECMQVNANAAWLLTTSCLPLLKQSRRGQVVFVHDRQKIVESAYWGAYGVSKAALSSLGKILRQELEGSGVDVLNFHPGPMQTALRARAYLAEKPGSVQSPAEVAKRLIEKLIAGSQELA